MKIQLYTELALAIALAVVLDLLSKTLPIPRLPSGGSVSLRMLPIFVVAFRHGWKAGVTAGGVYGVIEFMTASYAVHPIQVPLDYPVAFGATGMAGLIPGRIEAGESPGWGERTRILGGVLLGNGLRFMAHFTSGIVFWGQNAPEGQPVWLYSLSYNGSYMVPQTIVDIILLQLILRRVIYQLK